MMSRIRTRADYSLPPRETLRPVTAPVAGASHEIRELHRLPVQPIAIVVPIFGDARCGAATGTGQYRQTRMLAKKSGQALGLRERQVNGFAEQSDGPSKRECRQRIEVIQQPFSLTPDNGISLCIPPGARLKTFNKWYFGFAALSALFLLESILPFALF